MKRVIKAVLAVIGMTMIAVPLNSMAADGRLYFKGNLGLGMTMDADIDNMPENAGNAKMTFDYGFLGTVAVGYGFGDMLRLEGEYGWQKNDLDQLSYSNQFGNFQQGDLKTQSLMFNGYYDILTGSPWSPFIGAGIGWAKVDLDTPTLPLGDNDNIFAYQLMAGVTYAFNSQWSVDAQYRFFGTQDATIQDADFSMHSNDLMLGIRYTF